MLGGGKTGGEMVQKCMTGGQNEAETLRGFSPGMSEQHNNRQGASREESEELLQAAV